MVTGKKLATMGCKRGWVCASDKGCDSTCKTKQEACVQLLRVSAGAGADRAAA